MIALLRCYILSGHFQLCEVGSRSNCVTKTLLVNVVLSCSDVSLFSNKGNHSVDKSIPVLLLKRCKQKTVLSSLKRKAVDP